MVLYHLLTARSRLLPRFMGVRSISMYGDNCPLVLSPRQLRSLPASDVSILDVSWHMPNSPRKARAEFLAKRIPGAQYLDLDEVASPHPLGLKHMMPSGQVFAEACEKFGISPSSHVVLYDTHGVFSSPRALFMFKAFGHNRSSILDGGLPAWEAHGCLTESGQPQDVKSSVYPVPELDDSVIRSYDQIISNAGSDLSQSSVELVLDARSRGRYIGADPEPRPDLPSGHIPNSLSLPFTAFLETNSFESAASSGTYTTVQSLDGLHKALQSAVGPDLAKDVLSGKRKVVTSCGSGMTAGVVWLGLQKMGVERVGLYDESWTGYAARSESRIAKGE